MNIKILITVIFGLAHSVLGFMEDYGPFLGEPPKAFPLTVVNSSCCGVDLPSGEVHLSVSATGRTHKILLSKNEKDGIANLSIVDLSGKPAMENYEYDGLIMFGATFRSGRLNGDEIDDWVIELESGGCGLAVWGSHRLILLSGPNGFELIRLYTLFATDADYIDLNGDGRVEMVHTDLIYGDPGRDGKTHNYWTHNLLRFEGTRVVSANHFDRRFSYWVCYTSNPNHRPTTQLTKEQRQRLWEEQADDALIALAGEQ